VAADLGLSVKIQNVTTGQELSEELLVFGAMLDHTGFVVTDLARARRFYDAVAEALGLSTISNSEESFLLGRI